MSAMRTSWITAFTVAVLAITGFAGTTTAAAPTCGGKVASIVRTSGPDVIIGTGGPDVIVARGGDDQIDGRGGDDTICAGGGDDEVKGGGGLDDIFGNGGDDHLAGGRGKDAINGGPGSDRCVQNAGSGPERKCERADFSIVVGLPDLASDGVPINTDVTVRNHGPQRASFAVEIANSNTGVTCEGGLDSGTYPQTTLEPNAVFNLEYEFTCSVEGDPSSATVTATVIANARDPNPGNDSDSDTVPIAPD